MATSKRAPFVLALAGPVAAGKTTLAKYVSQQFGFVHIKTRDVLAKTLTEQGRACGEQELQDFGQEILDERGPNAVCELISAQFRRGSHYVVDSLRQVNNWSFFKERYGAAFKLMYVTADPTERRERFSSRHERVDDQVSFESRSSHWVELDVPNMINSADAVIVNNTIDQAAAQARALVLNWLSRRQLATLHEMLEAVERFHRKHGFDINTRNTQAMHYRIGLLIEELGEINECLSKGKPGIGEEHADLLILLLGNCITMGIDLEKEFWRKYEKIMRRPSKRVGDQVRVSHWRAGSYSTSDEKYLPVDLQRLLHGESGEVSATTISEQLDLFARPNA